MKITITVVVLALAAIETMALPWAKVDSEDADRMKECLNAKCGIFWCPEDQVCGFDCQCWPKPPPQAVAMETAPETKQSMLGRRNSLLDKLDHVGDGDVIEVFQERRILINAGNNEVAQSQEQAEQGENSVKCHNDHCGYWTCPDAFTCGDCACLPSNEDAASVKMATKYQMMMTTITVCCGGHCGCFTCPYGQCDFTSCTCRT